MLVGRCSRGLSGRKLQRKLKVTGSEQTTCPGQVKSEITHGVGNNRWVPQVSLLRPGIRATDSRWKPYSPAAKEPRRLRVAAH
jgi:hypothetical protein